MSAYTKEPGSSPATPLANDARRASALLDQPENDSALDRLEQVTNVMDGLRDRFLLEERKNAAIQAELRGRLEAAKKEIAEKSAEAEAERDRARKLALELKRVKNEALEAVRSYMAKAQEATAALKTLTDRQGALELEATAAKSRLRAREKQLIELVQSHRLCAAKMDQAQSERQQSGAAWKEEIARTEGDLARSLQAIKAFHEDQVRSRDALNHLQAELKSSSNELNQAREELARTQEELKRSQEEVARIHGQWRKSEEALARTNHELLKVRLSTDGDRAAAERIRNDLLTMRAQLDAANAEIKKLKFEGPLRELFSAKTRELEKVREAIQDLPLGDPERIRGSEVMHFLEKQLEALRAGLKQPSAGRDR